MPDLGSRHRRGRRRKPLPQPPDAAGGRRRRPCRRRAERARARRGTPRRRWRRVRARASIRPSRVGSSGRCTTRFAIRACTPPERSCTCKARSSAAGRAPPASAAWRRHEPMRPRDRFRAGSIVKMFVSVTVLQLTERGRLSLDARLPEVLPASVTGRVANAADITVRMLLGHRSGIPEWDVRPSTSRSRVIPRRCGRFTSCSTSRPQSRRCSRPGRATRTPTPTTTCSA